MDRQIEGTPWTRSDALVAVGAAGIDLLGYSLGNSGAGLPVSVTGSVLVVLAALPLLARRRYPVVVLAAVLLVSAAFNLLGPQLTHFGAAPAVALYSVARVSRPAVTASATVITAAVILLSQPQGPLTWTDAFSSAIAAVLVTATATVVRRWQQQVASNRQLLAEQAVAQERRRIARELHDIVAHHITTMQLMAGGARANLDRDTEVVREALVTLESSGRLALREMRQLLDVLRAGDDPEPGTPEPQPGVADLDRLVRDSGFPVELRLTGTPRPLEPTLGLTVYRIVQEALTNTRKHAGRARAVVTLTYGPDDLLVDVQDDGSGEPPHDGPAGPAGYGLVGMRERVALHGGSLTAGRQEGGGFRVTGRLPLADHTETVPTSRPEEH
ncbi:sensor histidine kinase [Kitasatospora sp. NPDC002227]|uniref:sensor histidine kinase n=1 Tax=Kitasatospora sp. NPDC002227 TaxID=3154773 RepID=UPI003327DCBB